MAILCSLSNMTLSFGQRLIFNQAQMTIHEGDRIGLIGLNGQGKSTLFNILTEQVHPDHTSPAFSYDKSNNDFSVLLIPQELNFKDFTDLSIQNYYLAFYPKLYSIHQKLDLLHNELTTGDAKALEKQQKLLDEFEFLGGWEIQTSYESYLKYFHLNQLTSDLLQLSGGEQRKLALSVGLSAKEKLVLWDEPTNHLDIDSIHKFEEELQNCQQSFMIISHDRYLLNTITNKIVHIDNGGIDTFQGTYLDYLDHLEMKEQERMKNLETLKNRHRREQAWMRQGIKARGTRSKKRVEQFHNIQKSIMDLKAQSKKSSELSLQHSGRKSKQLVEIVEGSYSYNEHPFLQNINVSIFKEDKIALIGHNGAGKTTLIQLLQGNIQLNSGQRRALDQLKILCFDQKRESLDLEKTPLEIIGDGMDMIETAFGQIHINSYLKKFLFTSDQVKRPTKGLSGGEKNRLQLALFMKQSADLWIFDEPTNDLDIETINLLEMELKNYPGAVLIIGHDRAFLDNVCDKTWLIYHHEIEKFEGGYSQVAPFLEAMRLEEELQEKKLEKNTIKENTQAPTFENQNKPKKLTYKEQKRLEQMEELIVQAEEKLDDLDSRLGSFDFSEMDENKTAEYEKLNQQQHAADSELQDLYKEWEELEAKHTAYKSS